MPFNAEVVLCRDLLHGGINRGVLKLDHLPALVANQVLMLRVAVVMVVDCPRADLDFAQQPRIDELRQSPVNRRPADTAFDRREVGQKFIGIKVFMLGEDVRHQVPLLVGEPLGCGPTQQVFAELLFRRLRNRNRFQRHRKTPRPKIPPATILSTPGSSCQRPTNVYFEADSPG
jgi:hypothetical protein